MEMGVSILQEMPGHRVRHTLLNVTQLKAEITSVQ